jgi:probable rRNA maturation factor
MSAHVRRVEIAVSGVAAPRWRPRLSRFCRAVIDAAGFDGCEISLLLCDDTRIAALNGRYRGKNRPTDVLSFPSEEGGVGRDVVGDIALSLPAVQRNMKRFGVTVDEEIKRLLVHGILHLAGMDHGRGKGTKMLALQEELIERLRSQIIIGE